MTLPPKVAIASVTCVEFSYLHIQNAKKKYENGYVWWTVVTKNLCEEVQESCRTYYRKLKLLVT